MTLLMKLHSCVKLAAPLVALVLAAGPAIAQSSKDTGTTRSRQAVELYKSISKPDRAAPQQRAARQQTAAKKRAPAQAMSQALQPLAAPANDDFADAIALQGQSGTVTGINVDATAEPGEPAHAFVGAFSSVWYTLTPNQSVVIILDTFGSDFDTLLAVYTGNRVNDLVEVTSNDDAGEGLQSQVGFLAEAGTTYRIAVDGFFGGQGSITLNSQPQDLAPNDDFDDAIAVEGQRGSVIGNNIGATFQPGEPAHAGFGQGSSVWYTFTPNRSRVTTVQAFSTDFSFFPVLAVYQGNSVNALTEVASSQSGSLAFVAEAGVTYRIAVDGDSTFPPTEGVFTLEFERTNQPPSPNDDFADAIALDGDFAFVDGNNFGATSEPGEPAHAGVAGISSVWYTFTPIQTGVTLIDTFGDFDTVLAVYTGEQVDSLIEVASNDDGPFGTDSQVAFLAQSGTTYRIAVDGFEGAQGLFTLQLQNTNQPPAPNDDFADAIVLEGRSGSRDGSNLLATAEPGEPSHADLSSGNSVWYSFTPNRSGVTTLTASVPGFEFFPVLAVYGGGSVDALDEVASVVGFFDDDLFLRIAELAFFAEAGVTYRIAVDADDFGGQGAFTLDFRRNNQTPPTNDSLEDAVALEGRRGSVSGNTTQATQEGDEPAHFSPFVGPTRSLWYSFTPNRTGVAFFDTFGSDPDTVVAVYTGDSIGNLEEVASNDDTASQENNFDPNRVQSEVAFLAERGRTYHVAVDGAFGSRGPITLNFRQTGRRAPANDAFANARPLRGETGVDSGFNVGASVEPDEPAHAGSGGFSSVWWRWRAPFTDEVTFTTGGSNFDTVLAVYQGDAVSALTELASNDDILGVEANFESLVTFSAQEGVVYRIAVDGFFGDEGSITLAFTRGDALLKVERGGGKEPAD